MSFQSFMHFFLLWNEKNIYILKNDSNQAVLVPLWLPLFGKKNTMEVNWNQNG